MRFLPVVLAFVLLPIPAFAAAVLGLSLDDGVTTAVHGEALSYTLSATNTGDETATAAHIAITLPSDLNFTSDTCASCTGTLAVAAPGLTYDGDIAAGEIVTIVFSGTVAAGATSVTVSATASAADSADASGSDTDTIVPNDDIAITANGPNTVDERSAYAYTIDVTAKGPEAATITVTAQLTGGATFTSADGGLLSCTVVDTAHVQCSGSPLVDPEGATEISINATAPIGDATAVMTATYTSSAIADPVAGNNQASVTTAVIGVNDPPVITAPISITSPYNGTATFTGANAITISDVDARHRRSADSPDHDAR